MSARRRRRGLKTLAMRRQVFDAMRHKTNDGYKRPGSQSPRKQA